MKRHLTLKPHLLPGCRAGTRPRWSGRSPVVTEPPGPKLPQRVLRTDGMQTSIPIILDRTKHTLSVLGHPRQAMGCRHETYRHRWVIHERGDAPAPCLRTAEMLI